jgi:hypothetical protein
MHLCSPELPGPTFPSLRMSHQRRFCSKLDWGNSGRQLLRYAAIGKMWCGNLRYGYRLSVAAAMTTRDSTESPLPPPALLLQPRQQRLSGSSTVSLDRLVQRGDRGTAGEGTSGKVSRTAPHTLLPAPGRPGGWETAGRRERRKGGRRDPPLGRRYGAALHAIQGWR